MELPCIVRGDTLQETFPLHMYPPFALEKEDTCIGYVMADGEYPFERRGDTYVVIPDILLEYTHATKTVKIAKGTTALDGCGYVDPGESFTMSVDDAMALERRHPYFASRLSVEVVYAANSTMKEIDALSPILSRFVAKLGEDGHQLRDIWPRIIRAIGNRHRD
jgi:hypothetical protein